MIKRILTGFLSVIAFVAGLLLTAWFVDRLFPSFDDFVVHQKMAHIERHIDDYDTLFLGSSRVYHQISPAIFDQVTREAGVPTRSLNIGVDAFFPPEDSYIAEYIASLRPKNLRWVFVEVSMFLPDWAEKNSDSPRAVYWHDWTRTSMAVREILQQQTKPFEWKKRHKRWKSWQQGLHRAGLHVQMYARKVTNFGRGGGVIGKLLKEKKNKTFQGMGAEGDGYSPLATPTEKDPVALRSYDKLLAERKRLPVLYKPLSPVGQENLERVLNSVREMGATPVLLVSPVLTRMFFSPRTPAKEVYLDFADVNAWPELYRREHLFDIGHLSKPGAEIYSRYIAEGWLAAYGPKKPENPGAVVPTTSTLDVKALTP